MSQTMSDDTTAEEHANKIEANSPVDFVVDCGVDGVQGELPWHKTDELLKVHNAAARVGRTVNVRYEDDEGNIKLRFPEK